MEDKFLKDDQFVNQLLNSRTEPSVIINRDYVIVAANAAYEKLHDFKVDQNSHCFEPMKSQRRSYPCSHHKWEEDFPQVRGMHP